MTLEALSRGAESAFSVDSDPESCAQIRENFTHFNVLDNTQLLQMSAAQAISKFAELNLFFDIIFLDPPYHLPQLGVDAIKQSVASEILSPTAKVIFEHRSKIQIPEFSSMTLWKQKKYGQSMLSFYVFPH